MEQIPSGTELARPFLPAKDFELSKAFYEALGFEKLLDGDVAIFRTGSGGFILQRYFQKEWAENFMMQLMVDDLDAWWQHIELLDLPGRFKVQAPRRPCSRGDFGSCMSLTRPECFGTSPNGAMESFTTEASAKAALVITKPNRSREKRGPFDRLRARFFDSGGQPLAASAQDGTSNDLWHPSQLQVIARTAALHPPA